MQMSLDAGQLIDVKHEMFNNNKKNFFLGR